MTSPVANSSQPLELDIKKVQDIVQELKNNHFTTTKLRKFFGQVISINQKLQFGDTISHELYSQIQMLEPRFVYLMAREKFITTQRDFNTKQDITIKKLPEFTKYIEDTLKTIVHQRATLKHNFKHFALHLEAIVAFFKQYEKE
jgi:CRISPR type III-A-associated protein Csm2